MVATCWPESGRKAARLLEKASASVLSASKAERLT
jgi:hypothetical protein